MSAAMGWIEDARRVGIEQVAAELSLAARRSRFDACVSCGGDAAKIYGGVVPRWRCYRCSAHGDCIDLVAYAVSGQSLRGGNAHDVRAWFASRGWCEPEPGAEPVVVQRLPIEPKPTDQERTYPPPEEVEDLYLRSTVAHRDSEAVAWLEARFGRGPVDRLLELGLVSAVPEGVELPAWAAFGKKPWNQIGYRLLFRAFDAAGTLRSVRVRCLGELPWSGAPKALPPAGYTLRGLVLASGLAQRMLAGKAYPAEVVVAEGEPQWLAACLAWPRSAVLGVVAGSWSLDLAARIPVGARVLIVCDHDEPGDRYAELIERSLRGRASTYRHLRSLGV